MIEKGENTYMEKYLDQNLSPEERAKDLLEKLSLEEKMGQICCFFGEHDDVEKDAPYGIGQVSTLEVRNMTSLEEAAEWQRDLQKQLMERSPHHIPAVFHMEGLCGAFIQGAASLPSGIGRASSFDPALEEKLAQIVARQETAVGITQVLAPVLDISRDSRMGRQGETYGEDPTLASAMGAAFTKGIQKTEKSGGRKAESVAKHFLGFHASQGAVHSANCEITERTLEEIYAKPFQAAISESDLHGIMPCYSVINGEPLSSSRKILTGLLRQQMGFDGVTVADYGAVSNVHTAQYLYESVTEGAKYCLEAGIDVETPTRTGYNAELMTWLQEGKADMAALDQAVYRILCAKFRMGLFDHPFALEGAALERAFYSEEDRDLLLQSARESMVLLKNDGILPIQKNVKKIVVIGCHGQNARSFFGGYTHLSMTEAVHAVANSLAGVEADPTEKKEKKPYKTIPGTQIQSDETEEFDAILKLQKPQCKNLVEGLREALPETEILYAYGYPIAGDDTSHFAEALALAGEADLLILTLGGKHGSCSVASMGEGVDAADINLPACQDAFIAQAAKLGKPMVGIHFNGRAISSETADKYLNAIVEAWNPSEMGAQAIGEVLTGVYNPCGRLPVSVAYHAGQLPVYYNHLNGSSWHQGDSIGFKDYVDLPHTPRYYFGHGLSYTTFTYGKMEISKAPEIRKASALSNAPEIGKTSEISKALEISKTSAITGSGDRREGMSPVTDQAKEKLAEAEVLPTENLRIALEIKNTGSLAGTEVVQLYLKDHYASKARPVMELAGFARVYLEAGEAKTVEFEIAPSQMAFLDEDMKWKIEAGDIEVLIGASSEDIRQTGHFRISQDARIDGRSRKFYAIGEIR